MDARPLPSVDAIYDQLLTKTTGRVLMTTTSRLDRAGPARNERTGRGHRGRSGLPAAAAPHDPRPVRVRSPTPRTREQLTYRGFLAELLLAECDDRDRRRSARRLTAAGFPREKWLSDFDYQANPAVEPAVIAQLATCAWVKAKGSPCA